MTNMTCLMIKPSNVCSAHASPYHALKPNDFETW